MHPIYDLLLRMRSANLGHEAVIEIMLALLGVMIAVLTLISGLVAIGIAVVSWFGYSAIRDEAARHAEQVAKDIASEVATKVAKERIRHFARLDEGSALVAAQTDLKKSKAVAKTGSKRQRATTDRSLRKEEE